MTANLPLRMFTLLATPLSGRPQWRSLQQRLPVIGRRHLRELTDDRPSRGKPFTSTLLRHHRPMHQRPE